MNHTKLLAAYATADQLVAESDEAYRNFKAVRKASYRDCKWELRGSSTLPMRAIRRHAYRVKRALKAYNEVDNSVECALLKLSNDLH